WLSEAVDVALVGQAVGRGINRCSSAQCGAQVGGGGNDSSATSGEQSKKPFEHGFLSHGDGNADVAQHVVQVGRIGIVSDEHTQRSHIQPLWVGQHVGL